MLSKHSVLIVGRYSRRASLNMIITIMLIFIATTSIIISMMLSRHGQLDRPFCWDAYLVNVNALAV